jgi:hypothetical protein
MGYQRGKPLHFTPTRASWLNLVERWLLSPSAFGAPSFTASATSSRQSRSSSKTNNRRPKPLIWTASVESILQKISRYEVICETFHWFSPARLIFLRDFARAVLLRFVICSYCRADAAGLACRVLRCGAKFTEKYMIFDFADCLAWRLRPNPSRLISSR